MREGLEWKAHSHEARVARTWNGKPGPQGTPSKFVPAIKIDNFFYA